MLTWAGEYLDFQSPKFISCKILGEGKCWIQNERNRFVTSNSPNGIMINELENCIHNVRFSVHVNKGF
jgi:hypothetical protein